MAARKTTAKKTTTKSKAKKAPAKKSRKTISKKTTTKTPEVKASSMKETKKTTSNKKYYWVAVLLLIAGVAWLTRGFWIAGTVNNQPIFRYEVVRELERQAGDQVLDDLVNKKLLSQEADRRGVSVTEEDVQAELDSVIASFEGQGMTLEAALEQFGLTMDSLRDNVRLQLTIEKMMSDSMQEITDEEAMTYFEENSAFFPEGTDFESLKDDLKQQMYQEKLESDFQSLLEELKNNAQINTFTNY